MVMSAWSIRSVAANIPRLAALVSAAIALTVLVGWIANHPMLRSVIPGAVEMKINTAFGLLTSAALLWVFSTEPSASQRLWARAGALLLVALGAATLSEYALGVNLRIDEAIMADRATAYNAHRGRMSPYTAATLIALGITFLALRRPKARWLGRAGAVIVLVNGVVSTLGYLWNAQELVTDQLVPPVAINTAIVFVMLASGILFADLAPTYLDQREQGQQPVEGTIVLALVFTFVTFAAGASYTYRTTAHFDSSLAEDERLERIRTFTLDLERGINEALGSQRRYLGSDTVEHAHEYAQATKAVQEQLRALTWLSDERRIDEDVLRRLHEKGQEFLAALADEIEDSRTATRSAQEILGDSSADALRKEFLTVGDPIKNLYADTQSVRRSDARRLRQYTLASILMLLGIVSGVAVLIVRSVFRDVRNTAETRRIDDLSQSILALLASTRSRGQALEGTLRLLRDLVPGSTAAFYAAAGNGDYDREAATELHLWCSHYPASDELLNRALHTGSVVQDELSDPANAAAGNAHRHLSMCVLVHGAERLGIIALQTRRALKPAETSVMARHAAHLAVTLSNLMRLSDLSALSEQLSRKNEMLEAQAQELERATRLKSEFLATMSHELRTPLNAVIGFAEVLRGNLAGELSEVQREYVGDILASGEHLLALINDILDLSKVEAGKMELDLEPVNIQTLLQNSISIVRERAVARRIRIDLIVEPPPAIVMGDARKLKQICYNLLSNAVKFSHDAGSVVVATKRRLRDDAAWLDISVSDTGIGISAADQARLFQPFVQADSSLAKHYEGTGLGLALVKRLVELHGGQVDVDSTPNMGSTFTVSLPLTPDLPPKPVRSRPVQRAVVSPQQTPLALVVEDRDSDAALLRLQLEESGFQVMRASNADQALELARMHMPALITLDILLHGTDGWQLLTSFKEDPELQRIPVVVVSVIATEQKGLALGALSVLHKPVQRQELAALCAALLRPHDETRSCRVLVVDDDPMAGQILVAYFASAECNVMQVHDGAAAIAEAKRDPPDLIALDLVMPGVGGFEVIEALRADERTMDVPVVIVTGKALSAAETAKLREQKIPVLEKGALRRADLLEHVRAAERQEA